MQNILIASYAWRTPVRGKSCYLIGILLQSVMGKLSTYEIELESCANEDQSDRGEFRLTGQYGKHTVSWKQRLFKSCDSAEKFCEPTSTSSLSGYDNRIRIA